MVREYRKHKEQFISNIDEIKKLKDEGMSLIDIHKKLTEDGKHSMSLSHFYNLFYITNNTNLKMM